MRIAMTGLAFAASLLAAVPGSEAMAVERSGWSRFQDPERHVSFEFPAHIFQQEATDGGERGAVFSTADGRRGFVCSASSIAAIRRRSVNWSASRNTGPKGFTMCGRPRVSMLPRGCAAA